MKKILLLLSAFLFFSNLTYSIDTNSIKYFPLQVDNEFYYQVVRKINQSVTHFQMTTKIERDTIINDKVYFYCSNLPVVVFPGTYRSLWLRADTLTGSLYFLNPNDSCYYHGYTMLDTLSGKLNDCTRFCPGQNDPLCYSSFDTATVFGQFVNTKGFHYSFGYGGNGTFLKRIYSDGFGILWARYLKVNVTVFSFYYEHIFTLIGCKINGVLYGDSTITNLQNISSELPEKFYLHQNFPNPFNAETSIRLDIVKSEMVILKVYDVLGREINTLVNNFLQPGSYQVKFNASNLTSGVYYYGLQTEKSSYVKKMVLKK